MYSNIKRFISQEMSDLDHKIVTNGKLSMQEVQYMDLLAHAEKSLLTCEAMKESGYQDNSEYGARRRDSMGRYADETHHDSYQHDSMIGELHSLMEKAPNEQIRRKYSDFVSEIQSMM